MHASSSFTEYLCGICEYILDTPNEGDENIWILCANPDAYNQKSIKVVTYHKYWQLWIDVLHIQTNTLQKGKKPFWILTEFNHKQTLNI